MPAPPAEQPDPSHGWVQVEGQSFATGPVRNCRSRAPRLQPWNRAGNPNPTLRAPKNGSPKQSTGKTTHRQTDSEHKTTTVSPVETTATTTNPPIPQLPTTPHATRTSDIDTQTEDDQQTTTPQTPQPSTLRLLGVQEEVDQRRGVHVANGSCAGKPHGCSTMTPPARAMPPPLYPGEPLRPTRGQRRGAHSPTKQEDVS